MPDLHILRTCGYFIGQVRGIGCRRWRTVGRRRSAATRAMSDALRSMQPHDKRARVLFCPTGETGSYYDPTVSMELRRV